MADGEILVIVEIQEILDEGVLKAYQVQARQQLLERGGKVLGRGGELFEGAPPLTGSVLIQRWASAAAFREWQSSEAYKPLRELRKKAAKLRLILVPAVA